MNYGFSQSDVFSQTLIEKWITLKSSKVGGTCLVGLDQGIEGVALDPEGTLWGSFLTVQPLDLKFNLKPISGNSASSVLCPPTVL